MICWLTSFSGQNVNEAFVDFAIIIEDRLADLIHRPGDHRAIGVVYITAGKHLVAITRRIEEVDRKSARDAVAARAIVQRHFVLAIRSAECWTCSQLSSQNDT